MVLFVVCHLEIPPTPLEKGGEYLLVCLKEEICGKSERFATNKKLLKYSLRLSYPKRSQ